MKNNKSPGSDGYTAEFFKFFWSDLKDFLVRAINDVFVNRKLPVSQRLGIITCLPKGDKPRQFIKNWRPITLLNVFYKIISACISKRIKSTLDILIDKTQTGFLSGRYIGENTRLVYDIMAFTEDKQIPGMLMLIDFEKAFDSVAWSFIYKVFNFFGFGENILSWLKILNCEMKASVLQNGFLSEQIEIQRGCRQGDPVAPYICLLCAEILSILIKNNEGINGIVVNDKKHVISQFADDTTLVLDGSQKSLISALETLEYYAQISGLRINNSKTKLIWIGSKKHSKEVFHDVRWSLDWGSTHFNLLGIDFSTNLNDIVRVNYGNVIPKIDALLHQWKRRLLTPIGRVTVLKTLIIPKLNHLFIALPNPSVEVLRNLSKKFFHFIWGCKNDRVKRDVVMQSNINGGLNMINLESFITCLKCTWFRRILQGEQAWMSIFEGQFGKNIGNSIEDFGDDFYTQLIKDSKNEFWKDVFLSWQKICQQQFHLENVEKELYRMPIWYNSQIKVNRKSLFIEKWYKKGVKVVGDFLDMNGNLLPKGTFEENFGIAGICFLQYEGICRAVRKFIKKFNLIHVAGDSYICESPYTFLFIFLAYLKTKRYQRSSCYLEY